MAYGLVFPFYHQKCHDIQNTKEIEIQMILSGIVSSILDEEACGRFMVSSNFGRQDLFNILHIIVGT
jgi:hypothetical protein